jgi:hypothetical protein
MSFPTGWLLAALSGPTLACSSSSTGPSTGNGGGGAVGTVTVGNISAKADTTAPGTRPSTRSPWARRDVDLDQYRINSSQR